MAASTSATEPGAAPRPPRLGPATLGALPAYARPRIGREGLRTGIVHFGPGAFHRAHQAVYTEDAMAATGTGDWGICAVAQRSRAALEALGPQGGLYAVLTLGGGRPPARVVAAVHELLYAPEDAAAVAAALADPGVRVVTLTVTEKGYRRSPAGGGLALADPLVRHDLAAASGAGVGASGAGVGASGAGVGAGAGTAGAPRTVVGRLVAGLRARRERCGAPLAVVCCDNLPGNGPLLRGLVRDFCAALPEADGAPLREWIDAHVAFPATMVDRIVPAPRPADRERVAALLGVRDEAAVAAEAYRRWVIEDRFPAGRPAWEAAGADLVTDVAPYETAKLRLLNATHSAVAYLGGLGGAATVGEALAWPELADFAERLTADELLPTLRPCLGMDLAGYRAEVLRRLAEPALGHTTRQVAADGTEKLPQRIVAPLREHLAAGRVPERLALTLAAWMRHVTAGRSDAGAPLPVDDPRAELLAGRVRAAASPAAVVDALLGLDDVFGPEPAASAELRAALAAQLNALVRHGARAVLRGLARA